MSKSELVGVIRDALKSRLPLHYICAHCGDIVEVSPNTNILDCGTSLLCGCGELTVVGLDTPEDMAALYRCSNDPEYCIRRYSALNSVKDNELVSDEARPANV